MVNFYTVPVVSDTELVNVIYSAYRVRYREIL